VRTQSTVRFSAEQSVRFLRALNVQTGRAMKSEGIAAVHDLRVAVRRLRQVLKILKPWLPREESSLLRRETKEIMAHAGEVRDRDTAIRLVRKLSHDGNRRLIAQLHRDRDAAARQLHESLRGFELRGTPSAWRRALRAVRASAQPAAAAAREILPGILKDYLHRGRHAACEEASAKELHRFRIATKKIRYTLELFAPLYGGAVEALAEKLKHLQTDLGSIHDCEATRGLVCGANDSRARKEILKALDERQTRKTTRFLNGYRRAFQDEEAVRGWKKILQHPG
jgi:CHAD domain-containing protein